MIYALHLIRKLIRYYICPSEYYAADKKVCIVLQRSYGTLILQFADYNLFLKTSTSLYWHVSQNKAIFDAYSVFDGIAVSDKIFT